MATKNVKLGIHRIDNNVPLPAVMTKGSACFDIAYSPQGKSYINVMTPNNVRMNRPLTAGTGQCFVMPGERGLIPTGYKLDIPEGYSMRMHIRSGLAINQGAMLVNGEAVIDSDYVDELFLLIYNSSNVKMTFTPGDRICQGELVETIPVEFEDLSAAPTQKGTRTGGMGSTGR